MLYCQDFKPYKMEPFLLSLTPASKMLITSYFSNVLILLFNCFRFSPTSADWADRKIVTMLMFTQIAKFLTVISLIPKISSIFIPLPHAVSAECAVKSLRSNSLVFCWLLLLIIRFVADQIKKQKKLETVALTLNSYLNTVALILNSIDR